MYQKGLSKVIFNIVLFKFKLWHEVRPLPVAFAILRCPFLSAHIPTKTKKMISLSRIILNWHFWKELNFLSGYPQWTKIAILSEILAQNDSLEQNHSNGKYFWKECNFCLDMCAMDRNGKLSKILNGAILFQKKWNFQSPEMSVIGQIEWSFWTKSWSGQELF